MSPPKGLSVISSDLGAGSSVGGGGGLSSAGGGGGRAELGGEGCGMGTKGR